MIIEQDRRAAVRAVSHPVEWDDLLASAPNGHVLQSFRWGEFKAQYGWQPERLAVTVDGAEAAAQVLWRHTPLGAVGYVPRGPVTIADANGDALAALLESIHATARARGAIFLKIEPNDVAADAFIPHGFRPSAQTVQPKATLMIDLASGLDAIQARMHSKTRYNIGLAARKGVEVRLATRDALPAFQAVMEMTGIRDGFAVRPQEYFENLLRTLGSQAELLLAFHEGDLLAAILVTYFGEEAIYLYGGSSNSKRSLMAPYLLQWEAMRRAYGRGCSRYDLWGVPNEMAEFVAGDGSDDLPEAQKHRRGDLWGVYRFKRGFGGRLVGYGGAADYVYSPTRFWAWTSLVPRVQRMIRMGKGTD